MPNSTLARSVLLLVLAFGIIAGLYFAKPFLVPVFFAVILAMLLLPLCRGLEKRNWNKALATLTGLLIFLAVLGGLISLLAWQISGLSADVGQMEQRVKEWGGQLQDYVSNQFGIAKEKQQQMLEQQKGSGGGQAGAVAGTIASGIFGFIVDFILTVVYIFLFLYFRGHIKKFILKITPDDRKKTAEDTMAKATKVGYKYLGGLAMMVVCLWILYGIGFSIVGVKNAIFFAILCGLLEVVPFVGNLLGTSLTLLMVVTQGGSSSMIIGVLVTYALVQFIQTYLLEPLVVGAEVNINPLFTILVLVAGELIWGIPGMVLAIPLLGMLKVVFDHVPSLQPYAYLIGEEKKKNSNGNANPIDKVKKLFGK